MLCRSYGIDFFSVLGYLITGLCCYQYFWLTYVVSVNNPMLGKEKLALAENTIVAQRVVNKEISENDSMTMIRKAYLQPRR